MAALRNAGRDHSRAHNCVQPRLEFLERRQQQLDPQMDEADVNAQRANLEYVILEIVDYIVLLSSRFL
ncbi:hypothetical protein DACRYDRAFT_23648 [Dacryopinax primogenitus]|uniref:Uncharacterized protein n=1 Tax=Dacryopinax primogenitus (strain DJM 731) TaxID=1858805 RepID=M5FV87_DACPD|nr:uncharacterized protein DACRYDRAFT_23648 [Dacryopinax primogenitus]EJT99529.1 hypothetical protein DACRYDRAFT_23648 [Dacryopinax primogenitus]